MKPVQLQECEYVSHKSSSDTGDIIATCHRFCYGEDYNFAIVRYKHKDGKKIAEKMAQEVMDSYGCDVKIIKIK